MKRRLWALTALTLALLVAAGAAPVAAHDGDRHPASFPGRIDLPDGWAPEGITAGRGTTVFVGSLVDGAIWKGNVRTGRGRVLVPGVAGNVAVGVEYEARANRLWVAGGPTGAVRVYDATSGKLLQTYTFSPVGFLNDLVVTRGAVFVTDSNIQQLDVIPLGRRGWLPGPTATRTLPLTGDISFVAGQFNANGIVASGGWLIVVNSFTGQLFRVNPRTGRAKEIDLGGASVSFGDGLELHGRTLYVVRNQLNEVDVFRLGRRLAAARLRGTITSADLDVPTTIAFQAGRLWTVNARFNTPVTPTTPYWITRLPAHP
jgi:sugar lactone lactonase YvrE